MLSALARGTMEVSTATKRSRHEAMVAVSAKSLTSPIGSDGRYRESISVICDLVCAPNWRLAKVTPAIFSNGSNASAWSERRLSVALASDIWGRGSPAHTRPILNLPVCRRGSQSTRRFAVTCKAVPEGIGPSVVPKRNGRLMTRHQKLCSAVREDCPARISGMHQHIRPTFPMLRRPSSPRCRCPPDNLDESLHL